MRMVYAYVYGVCLCIWCNVVCVMVYNVMCMRLHYKCIMSSFPRPQEGWCEPQSLWRKVLWDSPRRGFDPTQKPRPSETDKLSNDIRSIISSVFMCLFVYCLVCNQPRCEIHWLGWGFLGDAIYTIYCYTLLKKEG